MIDIAGQKQVSRRLATLITGSRLVSSYGESGGLLLHGTNLSHAGQKSASGKLRVCGRVTGKQEVYPWRRLQSSAIPQLSPPNKAWQAGRSQAEIGS
jgi:hypothetical protein